MSGLTGSKPLGSDGSRWIWSGSTSIHLFLPVIGASPRNGSRFAGISRLPCVHIYKEGELVGMHKISKQHQFAEFKESFQLHLQGNRAHR